MTDVVATGADTYLTGSDLPIYGHLKIGTMLRWRLHVSKTAAGTGVPTFNLRVGAGGTVTDTAQCSATGVDQTAQTDWAVIDVIAVARATGATTVLQMGLDLLHSNGVSGFKNDEGGYARAVLSTGFDATVTGVKAGLSINPGTSGVWTFQVVSASIVNAI